MKNWIRLIAFYLLVATTAALVWMAYDAPPPVLTIAFLDVGQGDAIFIQSPTGKQVLIDGGIDRTVLGTLSRVMPFFDRSLDVVIATHPDKDHIGGLPHVLDRYKVSHIMDSGLPDMSDAYGLYADRLTLEGARYRQAHRGDVIDIGGGAYLRVLYPVGDVSLIKEKNDASVSIQLVYGETEAMLTGDAGAAVEREILSVDSHLASDILKAGHHGSKTSTAAEFIAAVDPEYVIISAGKDNSYGHPHADVVERITAASSTLLGTYDLGTIIFTSDGKTFQRK